jgi:hypothetical protein
MKQHSQQPKKARPKQMSQAKRPAFFSIRVTI